MMCLFIIHSMIKSLNLPHQDFNLPRILLQVCKKINPLYDSSPQIDFLLLEKEMDQLQEIQSRTCQQIVEFVDQHHQQFIAINKKFENIQNSIEGSETVLRNLIPKIDMYKSQNYNQQSKIQQAVASYEKRMLQQQLIGQSQQQAEFLVQFVQDFENFINLNIEDLSEKSKFFIVRLLRKNEYIKNLFEHPYLQSACSDHLAIMNLLQNVVEQLQFYLSEQLSRIASSKEVRMTMVDGISLLEELKVWYQYMGKEKTFYDTIEQTIVGRQLSSLQSTLIANKQSLQVGKQEHIINEFFKNLFELVEQFPRDYPNTRILGILYRFLTKKELNFLYAPVGPTFPIFYSAYKRQVQSIKNEEIRNQLMNHHGWNLKFWADLRIKSIMDRSSKDKQNNLNKWIDIVFKKNFMLKGVKSYMIKLAFQLVNRYAKKIQQQQEFSINTINQCLNQMSLVTQTIQHKLKESFQQEIQENGQQTQKMIDKITCNVSDMLEKSLKKWTVSQIQMIINSCRGSLEGYKSFVMKVINSKKQKNKVCINKKETILKPLKGFVSNNPQLTQGSIDFITGIVLQEVIKHYDSEYAKQIYNHCQGHLTIEQKKSVMEIVAQQRTQIFQEQQKPELNEKD